MVKCSEQVDVCVAAGDVVIGDSRILHSAHPNSTRERRTGLTLWFIAGWKDLSPAFQMYWAQGAKPSYQNRPVSTVAWKLLEPLVPPMPPVGTKPQPAMQDWQGGGPLRIESSPGATALPNPASGDSDLRHATVTCTCGQCQLTFRNPVPRNHSECCCYDCRQKVEWATAQRAAAGSSSTSFVPRVSNLYYIEDDIITARGEEHLRKFLLRKPSGAVVPGTTTPVSSPFIVATCCHSVMCVPATYYNDNYVAVIAEACTLCCIAMEAKIRYAIEEFPMTASLPPYQGVGVQLQKHLFHCELAGYLRLRCLPFRTIPNR